MFLRQYVHYYMLYIYWIIFANCNYAQNNKCALDQNFYGHLCPRQKAANCCHPGLALYLCWKSHSRKTIRSFLTLLPGISFLLKSSEGVLRPVARCHPWFRCHLIYTQFFSFFKNPLESRSVTGSSSRPLFMRQRSIWDNACAKSSRVRLKT